MTTDREAQAREEAIALIDEINERSKSRKFYGIDQALHAKLCTIRATLARVGRTRTFAHLSPGTEVGDYVLVPREPTEAMLAAGENAGWDHGNCRPAIRAMPKSWSAMLAAAPTPPLPDALANDAVSEPLLAIPAGMKAYGPDHPDYPNAPGDWDGGRVRRRHGGMSMPDGQFAWSSAGGGLGNIIAYTPDPPRVRTPPRLPRRLHSRPPSRKADG